MQRKKINEELAIVYFQKMTATVYQEIQDQIAQLQADRPAKIAQLKAARALGDLSENTEYSTAKRELRHLESRLRFLNKQLQYAEIIKPADDQTVDLGTTVTVQFIDDDDQVAYQIVGKQEADLAKQKVSFDSPLGQAIMHKKVGQTVTVNAPQGSYQVKILTVKLSDSGNSHQWSSHEKFFNILEALI